MAHNNGFTDPDETSDSDYQEIMFEDEEVETKGSSNQFPARKGRFLLKGKPKTEVKKAKADLNKKSFYDKKNEERNVDDETEICEHCNKVFLNVESVTEHLFEVLKATKGNEEEGEEKTQDEEKVKQAKDAKLYNNIYICQVCKQVLHTYRSAIEHRFKVHSDLSKKQKHMFIKIDAAKHKRNSMILAKNLTKDNIDDVTLTKPLHNEDTITSGIIEAPSPKPMGKYNNFKSKTTQSKNNETKIAIRKESDKKADSLNSDTNDDDDNARNDDLPSLYLCHSCKSHFVSLGTVKKHFKNCNGIVEQERCSKCKFLFESSELQKHIVRHHINHNHEVFDVIQIISINKLAQEKIDLINKLNNKDKNTQVIDSNEINIRKGNIYKNTGSNIKNSKETKLYRCNDCTAHFVHKIDFEAHIKASTHDFSVIIKCPFCKLDFIRGKLREHLKEHHHKLKLVKEDFVILTINDIDMNSCTDNDTSNEIDTNSCNNDDTDSQTIILNRPDGNSDNEKDLKCIDKTTKLNNVSFNCGICLNKFNKQSELKKHVIENNCKSEILTCKICGLYLNVHSLMYHMECHKKQKVYNRKELYKNLNEVNEMRSDDNQKEATDVSSKKSLCTLYKCSKCGVHFVTYKKIQNHILVKDHDTKTNSNCKYCCLKFNKESLIKHLNIHHNKTLNLIPKDFKIIEVSRNSNDNNLFKCKLLVKDDIFKINLHKCVFCAAHFVTKIGLQKHLAKNLHNLETIDCKMCGLKFTSQSLRLHFKLHHSKLNLSRENFLINYYNNSSRTLTNNELNKSVAIRKKTSKMNLKKYFLQLIKCKSCNKIYLRKTNTDNYLHNLLTPTCSCNGILETITLLQSSIDLNFINMNQVSILNNRSESNDPEDKNTKTIEDLNENSKKINKETYADHNEYDSESSDEENNYKINLYKCKECNVCYLNEQTCLDHIRKHTPLNPSSCSKCHDCGLQFQHRSLEIHRRIQHKNSFNLKDVLIVEFGLYKGLAVIRKYCAAKVNSRDKIYLNSDDKMTENDANETIVQNTHQDIGPRLNVHKINELNNLNEIINSFEDRTGIINTNLRKTGETTEESAVTNEGNIPTNDPKITKKNHALNSNMSPNSVRTKSSIKLLRCEKCTQYLFKTVANELDTCSFLCKNCIPNSMYDNDKIKGLDEAEITLSVITETVKCPNKELRQVFTNNNHTIPTSFYTNNKGNIDFNINEDVDKLSEMNSESGKNLQKQNNMSVENKNSYAKEQNIYFAAKSTIERPSTSEFDTSKYCELTENMNTVTNNEILKLSDNIDKQNLDVKQNIISDEYLNNDISYILKSKKCPQRPANLNKFETIVKRLNTSPATNASENSMNKAHATSTEALAENNLVKNTENTPTNGVTTVDMNDNYSLDNGSLKSTINNDPSKQHQEVILKENNLHTCKENTRNTQNREDNTIIKIENEIETPIKRENTADVYVIDDSDCEIVEDNISCKSTKIKTENNIITSSVSRTSITNQNETNTRIFDKNPVKRKKVFYIEFENDQIKRVKFGRIDINLPEDKPICRSAIIDSLKEEDEECAIITDQEDNSNTASENKTSSNTTSKTLNLSETNINKHTESEITTKSQNIVKSEEDDVKNIELIIDLPERNYEHDLPITETVKQENNYISEITSNVNNITSNINDNTNNVNEMTSTSTNKYVVTSKQGPINFENSYRRFNLNEMTKIDDELVDDLFLNVKSEDNDVVLIEDLD